MRLRKFLIASALLNLVFATGWFVAYRTSSPMEVLPGTNTVTKVKNNMIVRTLNFTWQEVESADYVTYIHNLQTIGCPEQTIRDIIVADVNQLYAHRRATEIVSADHQWWRSDPDASLVQAAASKMKALDAERRTLLTKLLGPGWDTDLNALPPVVRAAISLTGPLLGDLSAETKEKVYNIATSTQDKIEAYVDSQRQQNKPIDPVQMAHIREEYRNELVTLLRPDQMEEFLLRYSQTAQDLREEMRGLDPTPEEFRALFQARDAIDSQAALYYEGDDAEALKKKAELEKQRDDAMKEALGPDRYANYKMNQDPIFRESKTTAEDLGAPAETVLPMYEINRLTQAELDRIRNDDTLTNEEKVEALAETQVAQRKSLEQILGPVAFQRWLKEQSQ